MRYWEQEERPYEPRAFAGRQRSVVWTLIVINVVIFLLEFLVNLPSLGGPARFDSLFRPFSLSLEAVSRGWLWQFITYAFLHDPDGIMHILFNMLFLYWFGREIEEVWGGKRFLGFYLGAAIFAGFCFVAMQRLTGRAEGWCIGASGAIYALVMAYRLYWPDRVILFMLFFPMRIKTFVWIVIGIETLNVLSVSSQRQNNVANIAHLGGLLFGYVVIRIGPAVSAWVTPRRSGRWGPNEKEARRRDEILDKISREGINSLTWRDRRFMRKFRRE